MGVYAADGQCVIANAAYAELVGGTREALLARNFWQIDSWKASGLLEACQSALQSHLPQQHLVNTITSFGKEVYLDCRILPTLLNGKEHLLMQFFDLTERKRLEDELRQIAFHDALTRLPNRRLFFERLIQALRTSKRQNSHIAVLFLDLNKFKCLNDTYGHDIGDQLLHGVAERLQQAVRDSDTVARLGGDEFVILLEGLGPDPERAEKFADSVSAKITSALSAEFVFGTIHYQCSASIGCKLFIGDESDPELILREADAAMYAVKRRGEA